MIKGILDAIIRRRTHNTMAKAKDKTRGELGCYGIVAVLAPLVVPVVLN